MSVCVDVSAFYVRQVQPKCDCNVYISLGCVDLCVRVGVSHIMEECHGLRQNGVKHQFMKQRRIFGTKC